MGNLKRVVTLAMVALTMACAGEEPLPDAEAFDCVPGQHRGESGCVDCAPGTYSEHENAERCEEHTACQPGTYVVAPGSDVSDRQCKTCPEGSYSSVVNQAACTQQGMCPAGTVQLSLATPTSGPVCETCPVGTFCAGELAPQEPCPEGTWDDDASSGTACVTWSACSPVGCAATAMIFRRWSRTRCGAQKSTPTIMSTSNVRRRGPRGP